MGMFIIPIVILCFVINGGIANNYTRTAHCSDKHHVLLVPGVLGAGGSNRACVSRLGVSSVGTGRLQLFLGGLEVSSTNLESGDGGCIDFVVPQTKSSEVELSVNLRYPEHDCSWYSSIRVRVSGSKILLVQTEKHRYRPGEALRARVLQLRTDLTPPHAPIEEVWIEGPSGVWGEGVEVMHFSRLRTRLGLAQIQYNLESKAPAGRWSVRARTSDGSQGSAYFWVGEYQLPPFQLTVRHAPKVLKSSERLIWNVCVRYPWGEAVEGMLVIRLRGAGTTGGVHTAVQIKAPKACHRHAVARHRVGLDDNDPPAIIVADFSFQEDGTRVWQNTTVVSEVVEKPITLQFVAKHHGTISQELPYKIKIRATKWDDKPSIGTSLLVCRSPANGPDSSKGDNTLRNFKESCDVALTDTKGVAQVTFKLQLNDHKYFRFQAMLQNDTSISTPALYVAVSSRRAHAAFGPLDSNARSHASRTLLPLYVNLPDLTSAITVHFVVITRGGILYRWGATTQCATTHNDTIATSPKNGNCDVTSTTQPKVMIPIRVTNQMCPDSLLVAYFVYRDEIISASKHFEADECFTNKVDVSWLSRQVAPKSSVLLQLSTQGPALCALSAQDVAAKWLDQSQPPKETLLTELRKLLVVNRNLTIYDALGDCLYNSEFDEYPLPNSAHPLVHQLSAGGVRLAGGDVALASCQSAPAPLLHTLDHEPRTDFAETWLWRLVVVSGNGSATIESRAPDTITRYEASALCVARNGVSFSNPAPIQIFREFFLHADVPGRLRQGDSTVVKYRLFNYLYDSLPVQIEITADSHLQPMSLGDKFCVPARASVSRRVEVKALISGRTTLVLHAKTVQDKICGNASKTINASDEIRYTIDVDQEGMTVEESKSALLCARDNYNQPQITWSWPKVDVVSGTEAWTVTSIGDLSVSLKDADNLVALPRGCGEQNMARLATNLLALDNLHTESSAYIIARDHVKTGFHRQLQYGFQNGGFSAFGPSDRTPSTWLTAFCLRYLRKIQKLLRIETPAVLSRSETWLLSRQMENGCFRNEGQVFHRELKGGLSSDGEIASVALTAYVVTSLVEGGVALPSRVLRNAMACLRALPPTKLATTGGVYAQSLLAYAFMSLRRYEDEIKQVNDASFLSKQQGAGLRDDEEIKELLTLTRLATRDGGHVWWDTGNLATSIEATGYAMLALHSCPPATKERRCAAAARAALGWLAAHRCSGGGFFSTQDTLVGMEAMSKWSHLTTGISLNVTVTSDRSLLRGYMSKASRQLVLHPTPSGDLKVRVDGTGCALVQATRSYNTLKRDPVVGTLNVQVSVQTDGEFDCDVNNVCYCAAILQVCALWSTHFPEMALIEISLPGGYNVDATLLYQQLEVKNTLLRRVELSSGKATLYLAVRDTPPVLKHDCYKVYMVGPKLRTRSAHITILDYYRPHLNSTQFYTIPEDCPSRFIHEEHQDIGPDNIYNSARSLTGDEVIITDDFSIQDLPDGIPLEDPLYLTENQTNFNYSAFSVLADAFLENNSDSLSIDYNETIYKKNETNSGNTSSYENDINNLKEINSSFESNDTDPNKNDVSNLTSVVRSENENINDTEEELNELPQLTNKLVAKKSTNYDINTDDKNSSNIEHIEINRNEPLISTIENNVIPKHNENISRNLKDTDKEDSSIDKKNTDLEENIQIAQFHDIDSSSDLEVPQGVEGPAVYVVMPPPDFHYPIKKDMKQLWTPFGYYRRRLVQNHYEQFPYLYV